MALLELRRAMARLRPDHRLALVMITVHGMSYDEASEALGVPVGTVKCRVFRARKLLHDWLLDDAVPPRPGITDAALGARRAGIAAADDGKDAKRIVSMPRY
jgi:RNA polymerase sigma-70 factor (ECF subfamily)